MGGPEGVRAASRGAGVLAVVLAASIPFLARAEPAPVAAAGPGDGTKAGFESPSSAPSSPPAWILFEGKLPRPPSALFPLLGLPMEPKPTREEMRAAVARLLRSGLVRMARLGAEGEGETARWVVRVKPSLFLRSLDIRGNFPVLESDLHGVIRLRQGTAYDPAALADVKKAIATYFRHEGFIGTSVEISKDVIEGGWVDLTIAIDKGRAISTDELEIAGDPDLPGFWRKIYWPLYLRWRVTPFFRFRESELLETAEALTQAYRRRGYPECEVKIESDVEEEKAAARVRVVIGKGPRLVLAIFGNSSLSDSELRDEITFVKEGATDDFEVQATTDAILARYRREGFLDVRVEGGRERAVGPDGDEEVRITFRIDEGRRTVVSEIGIEGSESIERARISRQILTRRRIPFLRTAPFSAQMAEDDARAIEALYRREGFGGTKVGVSVGEQGEDGRALARVDFRVAEGRRTIVRAVRLHYDLGAIPPESLLSVLGMKPGSPYSEEAHVEDRKAIVRAFTEAGYPYVFLASSSTDPGESEAPDDRVEHVVLDYDVTAGPLVRVGEPLILGNFFTRTARIRSEIEIAPGDPLAMSKIVQSKKNLRDLGVFGSVSLRTPGLDAKLGSVTPIVQVEEAPPWAVEAEVGYNSREKAKGSVTLADRNLAGRAVATALQAGYGQKGYVESFSITDPRLLGWKVRGSVDVAYSFDATSPLYHVATLEGGGTLTRELWPRLTGSLGLSAEDGKLSDIQVSPEELRVPEKNLTVLVEASVRYDRRDDFIDPHSGWWLGLQGASAGGPLGGDSQFFRYSAEGKYFVSPVPEVTIAACVRMGHIVPYGARAEVPLQQRFLLGGLFTVRGFKEDSLGPKDDEGRPRGGFMETIGNVELRFPVFGALSAQVFSDAGTLTDTWGELGWKSVRTSAGGGVRYETPVGPVRLDYAANLDRNEGEDFGRLYFSFGHPF